MDTVFQVLVFALTTGIMYMYFTEHDDKDKFI